MRLKTYLHGLITGLVLGLAFGTLGAAFAQVAVLSEPALALPTLPDNAKLVESRMIPCAEGVLGAAGYDANGNGDWEIAEVWRGGVRVAVIYFAPPAEQEIAHVYVVEGALVIHYTNTQEFLARYADVCDLGATTEPGLKT